jgi:hypothetical protein
MSVPTANFGLAIVRRFQRFLTAELLALLHQRSAAQSANAVLISAPTALLPSSHWLGSPVH